MKSTENIKFFHDMIENHEKEIHELCCKHMTVVTMEKDQVVMDEGKLPFIFLLVKYVKFF